MIFLIWTKIKIRNHNRVISHQLEINHQLHRLPVLNVEEAPVAVSVYHAAKTSKAVHVHLLPLHQEAQNNLYQVHRQFKAKP